MAGFCYSQGHFDCFEITHFADEDDIGILSKRRSKGSSERMSVGGDFALIDDAIFVIVKEFDRIFDRQDVIVTLHIDLIDHRGKRRRFTRTSRTGHEYQAAGLFAEIGNNLR